jgi:hypothetical protein
MWLRVRRGTFIVALAAAAGSAHADFVPGNLVVSQIGDGSTSLGAAAAPWILKEFTTTGSSVSSLNLAAAAPGGLFTGSGTSTSEGCLTLSGNGRYLMLGGYSAATGTTLVAATSGATNPRIVSRVGSDFSTNFSTALADAYGGAVGNNGNLRSVASDDGTRFWMGGVGSTTGSSGVRFAPLSNTTSMQLSSVAPTNIRVVNIFNNQLYCSSATGTFQGISIVGSGLPTSSPAAITELQGFPTSTGPSPYDFFFADTSTLYVADDRNISGGGGIQKWVLGGGTWSLAYTIGTGTGSTAGARGLTGVVSAGAVTLYATTAEGSANRLISIVDNGSAASAAVTTLATSGTNTLFRGVDFAPVPAPGALSLLTVGALASARRRR